MKKLILLSVVSFALAGCGETARSSKIVGMGTFQKQFERVPVTLNLRPSTPGDCNIDTATKALNQKPSNDSTTTLATCEVLYSCSDSAKNVLRTWSLQRVSFDMGRAAFKHVTKPTTFVEKLNGIYFPDTHRIFIDTAIPTVYETCAVLLHEMSHRADSNLTAKTDPTFDTEFPAYYLQASFSGELAQKIPASGLDPASQAFQTQSLQVKRDDFFTQILSLFPHATTEIKSVDYPKFAWE